MGQRVMIAMMLAPDPELLIADEPTSALDATVQAEILRLIEELVSERGMGLLLISHDLPLGLPFLRPRRRHVFRPCGRRDQGIRTALRKASLYARAAELHAVAAHPKERLPVLTRDPEWLK
jgi:peptide/nickel transport system ATP-binding protein